MNKLMILLRRYYEAGYLDKEQLTQLLDNLMAYDTENFVRCILKNIKDINVATNILVAWNAVTEKELYRASWVEYKVENGIAVLWNSKAFFIKLNRRRESV